jgi:hypothetical protein
LTEEFNAAKTPEHKRRVQEHLDNFRHVQAMKANRAKAAQKTSPKEP